MESITLEAGHTTGYPTDIDLDDVKIVAKVLQKHKFRTLPGASLADEIIQSLLAENAQLREKASGKFPMTQQIVEQLAKENATLHIRVNELTDTKATLFDVADMFQDDIEDKRAQNDLLKAKTAELIDDKFSLEHKLRMMQLELDKVKAQRDDWKERATTTWE